MDCRVVRRRFALQPAMMKAVQGNGSDMRSKFARLPLVLPFAVLALGGCASTRSEVPPSAGLTQDDDTFCQSGGKVKVGSPDYVYCRKDRDAARNKATTRADQRQRDLADFMMTHPYQP
jgi:hypothetical protein